MISTAFRRCLRARRRAHTFCLTILSHGNQNGENLKAASNDTFILNVGETFSSDGQQN